MSVKASDITQIAHLARIGIDEQQIPKVADRINAILAMVDTMQAVDTSNIEPMANPLDASQRLRKDAVTETNHRDDFQAIAPQAEDGLDLVTRVIY
jgi:aspartyl-tRNA(Asn)/glutamyl-tRNA(Gln) amidotransferase subunit C